MLLKRDKTVRAAAPFFLYDALSEIERCGNVKVDTPVFTKEGELRAASREGAFYMLKKWYQGRECDVRQEQDVVRAAAKLARLMLALFVKNMGELTDQRMNLALFPRLERLECLLLGLLRRHA